MKHLTIKRLETGNQGTFGVLINGGIPFGLTLERQWLNNQSNISCIPEGGYLCKRVKSPKFGNTFEVTDVTGRSHILFHKGNLDDDYTTSPLCLWLQKIVTAFFSSHPALIRLDTMFLFPPSRYDHCA